MTAPRRSIALCGAGMISHAHAGAAHHLGLGISAVASRSSDRRVQRSRELGAQAVTYDQLPAGCDIVIVATPPAQHFDHVVQSLERGAAVVVEKPLVATLNEADRLVTIAHRHGGRVLYAENLAYAPAFRKWINEISTLGDVQHLSLRMEQGPPTWGDFLHPHWGGGVLFDLGVHPIALAVLTARAAHAGEIVAVSARMVGGTTDEYAQVTLRCAQGLAIDVTVSWRSASVPHWNLQAASPMGALTLEFMPEVTLERNGEPISVRPAATNPPMIDSFGYVDQLRAFLVDLDEHTNPWMNVEFGRWVLEIVCACYVSARHDGQEMPVPSGCDRTLTPHQLWRGE